ncbi:hypothetical protein IF2G_01720 [Cordyceps javanica]|nr:hypothetical protein IF2G_01720 [Cordyceps javanica]
MSAADRQDLVWETTTICTVSLILLEGEAHSDAGRCKTTRHIVHRRLYASSSLSEEDFWGTSDLESLVWL